MNVVMPLPHQDFDPSEVAVTWQTLTQAGHTVRFATPDGQRAWADPVMLSGQGLDPWGWVPGLRALRLVGLLLRANRLARAAHACLARDPDFLHPLRHDALRVDDFDALVLPGGHAQGMRAYLESDVLQAFVADFFDHRGPEGQAKPVAAICHGVLLAARSRSPRTGVSVLHGLKTTALTWKLEHSAWTLTRWFARFWDPDYYRTYRESPGEPAGYWGVQQEVQRALANPSDFVDVPTDAPQRPFKTSGLWRDTPTWSAPAFIVQDGRYLSARWPGDVHTFARRLVEMLAAPRGGAPL